MSQRHTIQFLKAGLVIAWLVLTGLADRAIGFEISLLALYLLPLGLAVWFFGLWSGIAVATAAALAWTWADPVGGLVYAKPWIVYLNAGSRLIYLFLGAFAIEYLVANLRRKDHRRPWVSDMLATCADCGKVRDQSGYWWDLKSLINNDRSTAVRTKLCPDCARRLYAAGELPAGLVGRQQTGEQPSP